MAMLIPTALPQIQVPKTIYNVCLGTENAQGVAFLQLFSFYSLEKSMFIGFL